jgi:hypothetical protein
MEALNSSWLLHMIDTSAKKPADRLLSIYSCLNTWMLVPGVREQVSSTFSFEKPLMKTCPVLTAHLIKLGSDAKLTNPTVVVTQLFILLQGAIAEELRSPGTGALLRAQDAAKALVKGSSGNSFLHKKSTTFMLAGTAASIAFIGLLFSNLLPFRVVSNNPTPTPNTVAIVNTPKNDKMSPDLVVKVLALKENFDSGNCPAPHLLQMPQDQVSAYMDVVNYRSSDNPDLDSERLRSFLNWYDANRAWECYFKALNQQKVILGMGK